MRGHELLSADSSLQPALSGAVSTLAARSDRDALRAYLESLKEKSPNTRRVYSKELSRWLWWVEERGPGDLRSLRIEHAQAYVAFLRDTPEEDTLQMNPKAKVRKKLAPVSYNLAWRVIAKFMRWLVRVNYLQIDAFSAGTGLAKVTAPRPRELPKWAVDAMLESCSLMPEITSYQRILKARARFIILILFFGWLRREELARARKRDLVTQRTNGVKQHWLSIIGKGGKRRDVVMSDEVVDSFWRYRSLMELEHPGLDSHTEPLIYNERCRPLSATGIYRVVIGLCEVTGARLTGSAEHFDVELFKDITTHWFRHGGISYAVNNGTPIEAARDNAGHESVGTTSIYLHTDRDKRHADVIAGMGLVQKAHSVRDS